MDTSIGPAVPSDIRAFDFTVLFEEAILRLLPRCLFFAIVPLRVRHLFRQPKKVAVGGFNLCSMKGITWLLYVILQLVQLILCTRPAVSATIPSVVLALLGSMAATVLSYLEHGHSKRPSTMLTIWALFTLSSEAASVRTMWLAHQEQAVTIVKTAALLVLLLVVVLESLPKSNFVDSTFAPYSKEESVGMVNRSFFWWLNPLFIYGHKHELRPENLPPINFKLLSGRASPRLVSNGQRMETLGLCWSIRCRHTALPSCAADCCGCCWLSLPYHSLSSSTAPLNGSMNRPVPSPRR